MVRQSIPPIKDMDESMETVQKMEKEEEKEKTVIGVTLESY